MFLRAAHRPCLKSKQHWRPLVLNSSARQRIGRASALPHRRLKTDGESPNRGAEFKVVDRGSAAYTVIGNHKDTTGRLNFRGRMVPNFEEASLGGALCKSTCEEFI